MSLEPTFALTPRKSRFYSAVNEFAVLYIFGPDFNPNWGSGYRHSFEHQHTDDELRFTGPTAGDPAMNYALWAHRRSVPHVELLYNLSAFGAHKELALVFGFDAVSESRLLIYSSAGLLDDVTLVPSDYHFLIEVEGVEQTLDLFFIHSRLDGSDSGGHWYFKGITGYVI